MSGKRKVEVFSAGCSCCQDAIAMVRRIACPSCDIEVLDMHDPAVAIKAEQYGVRTVPAIAVDGRLAECCIASGPAEAELRSVGVGRPLP